MDQEQVKTILSDLGIAEENAGACSGSSAGWISTGGRRMASCSPINGEPIADIIQAGEKDYETLMQRAVIGFEKFKMIPAPERGQVLREIADALRAKKKALGALISLETGKIRSEGEGEVQEMIDIADFAVGLSRQLYGLTMHSERRFHRMYEQWHPLGIVGVITAFNFPAAPWSWNTFIAAACGNAILFKPSSKAFLTAIGIMNILAPVVDRYELDGVFNMIVGPRDQVGQRLLEDSRIPLISATGSVAMGRKVAVAVASRLGRSLLELGGNNAIIVAPDADLDMALRATVFGAVGTAGQRCTSTRRIIVHESVKDRFVKMLKNAYKQVTVGNPLDEGTLMGPLINQKAVDNMQDALAKAESQGARIVYGGESVTIPGLEKGHYVRPAIVETASQYPIVHEETFAPILYVMPYTDIDHAIALHNDVPQGLSSAVFTNSLKIQERFLSHQGSDCGIANVNIGTSGAEIGGAFGGEKQTGGGRESGSDAWKAYMRRQTNTINWGDEMPLAQGITFNIEG